MVERRRREQATQAQVTLDEKGRILEGLLPDKLREFEPEVSSSFDLVEVTVKPDSIPSVCSVLKENPDLAFDFLLCLCVVDYEEQLQVVYHLYSTVKKHKMALKASVPTEATQYSHRHIGLARRGLVRARGARPFRGGLRRPSQHDAPSAVRGVRGIPRSEEL